MPADQGPPSAEVLAALVVSLRSELAQARAELERARERIAELEARLRQTPRNSSKPPSSERLAKPAPRSLRKKSGRRPAVQDGHNGQTLTQVASPDREAWHEPGGCGRCGAALAGRPVTGVERRQVFYLPPARAEVTEHQLIERECACGHRTKAAAPAGARSPGPVRAADRRSHRLPVHRAVPVQEPDGAGAGRAVRRPAVLRGGRRAHRAGRRAAGRVPGACPGTDRRQRRGRV